MATNACMRAQWQQWHLAVVLYNSSSPLPRLATIVAESDGVEKHVFVRRAQEALGVARVRGNGYVWTKGLQAMAYGGGRCYQTGLDRPTEEVG